jgi:hypothetical protein
MNQFVLCGILLIIGCLVALFNAVQQNNDLSAGETIKFEIMILLVI